MATTTTSPAGLQEQVRLLQSGEATSRELVEAALEQAEASQETLTLRSLAASLGVSSTMVDVGGFCADALVARGDSRSFP